MTLTANAANANGTVRYTFLLNNGTTLKAASTSNTCTWTPTKAGTYIAAVRAVDSSYSITATSKIVVSASGTTALSNTSTISSTSITKGSSVTVTLSATGGKGGNTYGVWFRRAGTTSWIKAQDYGTNRTVKVTPAAADTYEILAKVKDSAGAIAKKTFTVKVTSNELKNTSKLSASTITLGSTITVTASASGGKTPYQFAVYYKKASKETYTAAQKYASTTSIKVKPAAATTYDVLVKVKDAAGKIVKKYFTVKVTK